MKRNYPFITPIQLPQNYHVHDFTSNCVNGQCQPCDFTIGKYNEQRNFYPKDKFNERIIHLGIDFGAPANTPIYSVSDCEIYYFDYFGELGDYGGLLVTKNIVNQYTLFCAYGHISIKSLKNQRSGNYILKGQQFGWVGDFTENGNWPPHLHFQILTFKPKLGSNIPGLFSINELSKALKLYPDPQIYFGRLY